VARMRGLSLLMALPPVRLVLVLAMVVLHPQYRLHPRYSRSSWTPPCIARFSCCVERCARACAARRARL
jgi:hypothetical protein